MTSELKLRRRSTRLRERRPIVKHTDTGEHIMSQPCRTHAAHEHHHHATCGHKSVKHDGHIDYEHDGHLHRVHDGHVDECDGEKAKN